MQHEQVSQGDGAFKHKSSTSSPATLFVLGSLFFCVLFLSKGRKPSEDFLRHMNPQHQNPQYQRVFRKKESTVATSISTNNLHNHQPNGVVETNNGLMCTRRLSETLGIPLNISDPMQCLQNNVTFLHIPKTAGTYIEHLAKVNSLSLGSNYDHLRWDLLRRLKKEPSFRQKYQELQVLTNLNISKKFPEKQVCTYGWGDRCCSWWHIPPKQLQDWRPYFLAPIRFCVVRHPLSRALSEYAYRTQYKKRGGLGCPETKEELLSREMWIIERVKAYAKGNLAGERQDCHWIPQSDYIEPNVDSKFITKFWNNINQTDMETFATSHRGTGSCNVVLQYENLSEQLHIFGKWSKINFSPNYKESYSTECPSTMSHSTRKLFYDEYKEDFDRFGYSPYDIPHHSMPT
eukprot:m.94006 g.94006  ORF g.94006 m.94006 type:complete len:403 (+) comp13424_c0_seq4:2751-3959(+)